MTRTPSSGSGSSRVELFWLPLGAGGHSVRWNGRIFEALVAARERRPRQDLYHSALMVTTTAGRHSIELAPVPDRNGPGRGVVVEGPVGLRWAGRFRWFRYEVRCWRGGVIPDAAEAVQSPQLVSAEAGVAEAVLTRIARVPILVWGRDEAGAGEMWNSNSLISWLLEQAGIDAAGLEPPAGGRAPGWNAGVVVARRAEVELRTEAAQNS